MNDILLQNINILMKQCKEMIVTLIEIQKRLESLEINCSAPSSSSKKKDIEIKHLRNFHEKDDDFFIDENGQEAVKWWLKK